MNSYTIEEFAEEVKEVFYKRFPAKEVRIDKVDKNNRILTGIAVIPRGEEKKSHPVLYLDNYFDIVQSGVPKWAVIDKLAKDYIRAVQQVHSTALDMGKFTSKDYILKHVTPRLVSAGEHLNSKLHDEFLDMGVTYSVRVEAPPPYGFAAYEIPEGILESRGMTRQELTDAAYANLGREITAMSSHNGIWSVSNPEQTYGASMMLSSKVRAAIAGKIGDFIALPVSVNQWACIPAAEDDDLSDLIKWWKKRRISVPAEEKLSDSIYRYNSRTDEFSIVKLPRAKRQKGDRTDG